MGEYDTRTDPDCVPDIDGQVCAPKVVRMGVEDIIQHSGWVNGAPQFYDDIALVRLSDDVKFSGNYFGRIQFGLNYT